MFLVRGGGGGCEGGGGVGFVWKWGGMSGFVLAYF